MLRDYFNKQAEIWDKTASETDSAKLAKLAAQIELHPGDVVLDVGTGTGVFLHYILQRIGTQGHIYALDIAEKMLARAQQKHPQKNIKFICASVEEIPLPADTCNAVICYSSFPHFSDKPLALREMKRVLKKGGVLFIGHTSSREHINHIHSHHEMTVHDLLPDAVEMTQLLSSTGFIGVKVVETPESYMATGRKT